MKVCIIWTQDIYQTPWDYLLTALGISRDEVYIALFGREAPPTMSKMTGAANLLESVEHLPPGPLVVASPKDAQFLQGETCLHCLEHPKDAIYVFGSDNTSLSPKMFGDRTIDHTVYIPTDGANLHSHVAAAMILHDRRYKQWLTR